MEKELYREMANLEAHHWWFVGRRKIILDTLRRFSSPAKGPLLDVGIGTGENAAAFIGKGYVVEGIENSPDAIFFAKAKVPTVPITQTSFPSDAVNAGKYTVITMLDVIEHLDDDRDAMRAAAVALKSGGIVILTTPAFPFLWTSHDELVHHKRRYRRGEIQKLIRDAGLEPVFVSYFNFFLFPAIALVRVISKMLSRTRKESDFSATPPFVNPLLAWLFGLERFLLRVVPLPFGVSLIAVAKK